VCVKIKIFQKYIIVIVYLIDFLKTQVCGNRAIFTQGNFKLRIKFPSYIMGSTFYFAI